MHDHENSTGKYDGLDRDELRSMVWADTDTDEDRHRLAYDPRFCQMFGATAGLMLGQLVFWSDKGHDADGWVFKTKEDINAWGLGTREQIDGARHRLKGAGVLEEDKRPRRNPKGGYYGPSPVLHYRVDLAALAELLDRFGEDPDGTIASIKRCFKQRESGSLGVNSVYPPVHGDHIEQRETHGSSSGKPATRIVENPRLKQRETRHLNRGISALPITESTDREDNREDKTEITNREGGGNPFPPLPNNKDEYKSTSSDDNVIAADGESGVQKKGSDEEGMVGDTSGVGDTLEEAIRAGRVILDGHDERRNRRSGRRHVAMGDGELVEISGRAREGRRYA